MKRNPSKAFGTGRSVVIRSCQICGSKKLNSILFLGYLPPVNQLHPIGEIPREQPSYPAQLLFCPKCSLAQLGLIVDAHILFPKGYPYTSGTTKLLRDNFFELSEEVRKLHPLKTTDLIVDIGSNDGTLLSNFQPFCRVVGITPEDIGKLARKRGVPTLQSYFNAAVVKKVIKKYGRAQIITAANVFAHMEDIHSVMENITNLLAPNGIFISESHYFSSLVKTLQYDTIYHEHLRYYSLTSLSYLLKKYGFRIIHAKKIPTHGGSFRIYATRSKTYTEDPSVQRMLKEEKMLGLSRRSLAEFRKQVIISKLRLHALLEKIKKQGKRIFGISAPSRATTLINYVGIDDGILECVVEIKGSYKIGKYVPGTLIPIVDEERLFREQPEYALILSWHIASELITKLLGKGYRGKFILPLPNPKVVSSPTFAV